MRRFLSLAVAALLASCVAPLPAPAPRPIPQPVEPTPQPEPARVLTYEETQKAQDGVTSAQLKEWFGKPYLETFHDDADSTRPDERWVLRWAALGSTGDKRWLVVEVGPDGKVDGRALWKRP